MNEKNEIVTSVEQMIVTAARLIKDGDVIMVGTQWPVISSLLAKSLHAPNVTICIEGGIILNRVPDRIPLFTGDPAISASALYLGDSFQTMGMVLHAGRADMALLSAASIDRYGNINTTCFGDYSHPKVRLGGSGGACDFGSLAPKTIIVFEHEKRRFPESVDFITTPGYLQGKKSRFESGLRTNTGPYAVVTTLGLFHFDEDNEMFLKAFNPSSSVEEIRESVQWNLKVDDNVKALAPPNKKELEVLRHKLDPEGMYLKNARQLKDYQVSV